MSHKKKIVHGNSTLYDNLKSVKYRGKRIAYCDKQMTFIWHNYNIICGLLLFFFLNLNYEQFFLYKY